MNFINAATKKERTHVEEIIKSQPVMPHEGITATEIGICGKQNLFMDVYRPDNDAEKASDYHQYPWRRLDCWPERTESEPGNLAR